MEPAVVYTLKRYPENLTYSDKFLNWVQIGSDLERHQRIFTNKTVAKRRAQTLYELPLQFIVINDRWEKIALPSSDFQIIICEQILLTNHEETVKHK